jgi:hypothetical protein
MADFVEMGVSPSRTTARKSNQQNQVDRKWNTGKCYN